MMNWNVILREVEGGVEVSAIDPVASMQAIENAELTAVSGDLGRATWAVLALGLLTGVPLIWVAMRRRPENDAHDQH